MSAVRASSISGMNSERQKPGSGASRTSFRHVSLMQVSLSSLCLGQYVISNLFLDVTGPAAEVVNRSVDGGLHWGSAITLETGGKMIGPDKPTITADPTNSNYVYAVWQDVAAKYGGGNKGGLRFARTTDGGNSWEPV